MNATIEAPTVNRIPYLFDFDEMLRALVQLPPPLTADDIAEASCRLGRRYAPELVYSLHATDHLTQAVATVAVPEAWSDHEFPLKVLGKRAWLTLFKFSGFTIDGKPADRPAEPTRVYRGADEVNRLGWSWTTDIDMARWFAARRLGTCPPRCVWTLLAPPDRQLAHIGGPDSRQEAEVVVNARGLKAEFVEMGEEARLGSGGEDNHSTWSVVR